MADQNLISRNTASPISWHSLTLMQIQSVHSSRKLNLLGKGFLRDHSKQEKKSDSVTDRPPWSVHRGRACPPPLLYWRRWFGGRVKMWAGSVPPSRCLCLGCRSPQSSDSDVIAHGPLHHILYHLMNTHTHIIWFYSFSYRINTKE